MGLFDRKKLEKEKINLQTSLDEKIPDYLITSRFLKLFPDVVKRVDILRDLINLNFSKEQYKKFLDCYDNDSGLAEFLLVFYMM